MDRPHSSLLRRGRFSEPGRIYLLTTVTRSRQPFFQFLRPARAVLQQLRHAEEEQSCRSLAWVVMPDHLHWLIELRTGTLGALMRRFKSRTSHALYQTGGGTGRIWQPGYQDRAIRREEDVQAVARYIVSNPLRAGLVGSVREYSHWDAVWL
ncbi:transposase [Pseudomonas parafulva]|uniref:REP-associated tyrosine transposase n=1 Tax=Pseudomonas parafulva TaxID=157782 RepID=UPI00356A180F